MFGLLVHILPNPLPESRSFIELPQFYLIRRIVSLQEVAVPAVRRNGPCDAFNCCRHDLPTAVHPPRQCTRCVVSPAIDGQAIGTATAAMPRAVSVLVVMTVAIGRTHIRTFTPPNRNTTAMHTAPSPSNLPPSVVREVYASLCAHLPPRSDHPEVRADRDELAMAAVAALYPGDALEALLAAQINGPIATPRIAPPTCAASPVCVTSPRPVVHVGPFGAAHIAGPTALPYAMLSQMNPAHTPL
jgi:hypothetical protein